MKIAIESKDYFHRLEVGVHVVARVLVTTHVFRAVLLMTSATSSPRRQSPRYVIYLYPHRGFLNIAIEVFWKAKNTIFPNFLEDWREQ
jgi:hypothetical protein